MYSRYAKSVFVYYSVIKFEKERNADGTSLQKSEITRGVYPPNIQGDISPPFLVPVPFPFRPLPSLTLCPSLDLPSPPLVLSSPPFPSCHEARDVGSAVSSVSWVWGEACFMHFGGKTHLTAIIICIFYIRRKLHTYIRHKIHKYFAR